MDINAPLIINMWARENAADLLVKIFDEPVGRKLADIVEKDYGGVISNEILHKAFEVYLADFKKRFIPLPPPRSASAGFGVDPVADEEARRRFQNK